MDGEVGSMEEPASVRLNGSKSARLRLTIATYGQEHSHQSSENGLIQELQRKKGAVKLRSTVTDALIEGYRF